MRILLLLLVLAPAVTAQSWSMRSMVDEMVPVLLDASRTDFVGLRGDLLDNRDGDSLWASAYRPAGQSGPLAGRVSQSPSRGLSMFWFTIAGTDLAYVQGLFGDAMAALDTRVGGSGDGWQFAAVDTSPERKVAQWVECPVVGRVFEVIYQPIEMGAAVTVSLARPSSGPCPSGR